MKKSQPGKLSKKHALKMQKRKMREERLKTETKTFKDIQHSDDTTNREHYEEVAKKAICPAEKLFPPTESKDLDLDPKF